MKKLAVLLLAAGAIAACGQPVLHATTLRPVTAVRTQSDAGIRKALQTAFKGAFQWMDKDQSGDLNQQEWGKLDTDGFAKADKNRDSKVSLREFLATGPNEKVFMDFIRMETGFWMAITDTNKDGSVTYGEFGSWVATKPLVEQKLYFTVFNLVDKGHDMKLNGSELEDAYAWIVASFFSTPTPSSAYPSFHPPAMPSASAPASATGPMAMPRRAS